MRRVPVSLKFVRGFPLPNWAVAKVPFRRLILWRRSWPLERDLLAHELCHVLQAERHPGWPIPYVIQWIATGFRYKSMPFEVEARIAARDPWYLAWASDIMAARAA